MTVSETTKRRMFSKSFTYLELESMELHRKEESFLSPEPAKKSPGLSCLAKAAESLS